MPGAAPVRICINIRNLGSLGCESHPSCLQGLNRHASSTVALLLLLLAMSGLGCKLNSALLIAWIMQLLITEKLSPAGVAMVGSPFQHSLLEVLNSVEISCVRRCVLRVREGQVCWGPV